MFGWLKSSSKTPAARRQELRDASRPPKGTTTEPKTSPLARRNTAPAFAREQARRERAMMSSSFLNGTGHTGPSEFCATSI